LGGDKQGLGREGGREGGREREKEGGVEKQKQGKKRAKMVSKVSLSQESFWAVISKT